MKNLIDFPIEELLRWYKIVGKEPDWGQLTLVLVHFLPCPPMAVWPLTYTDTPNLPFPPPYNRRSDSIIPKIFVQPLLHYV